MVELYFFGEFCERWGFGVGIFWVNLDFNEISCWCGFDFFCRTSVLALKFMLLTNFKLFLNKSFSYVTK